MISASQLKKYRSLQQKKYRQQYGQFLIEGFNLCEAALRSDFSVELLLINQEAAEQFFPRLAVLAKKQVKVEFVPDQVIRALSESVSSPGMIAVVKMPQRSLADLWNLQPHEILILDQIRDPGNLGTILRTAEWFGIQALICSEACVDLFNSKVLRSSAGAYFQLPLVLANQKLIEVLPELLARDYNLLVANPTASQSYFEMDFRRPFALIIGSERQGVSPGIYDFPLQEICIPRRGRTDSLNVAVAAAILLAAAVKPVA